MRARFALALGAAIATGAALAPAALGAGQPIGSGDFDWGVKKSFRDYITGPIAVGSVEATNGATRRPDGTFRWPVTGGEFDLGAETGEVRSKGTVRFSGHGGVLDVTISDPRPVISGEAGVLYADVKSRSQDDGQMKSYPNVDLATLDLSAVAPIATPTGFRYEAIPATLTQNGSPAFGGFYDPGEQMDPVTFEAVPGSQPVFQAPKLKVPAGAQRLRDGEARVARITCTTGPCVTKVAKRVRFRAGGERYRAKVAAPRSVASGERASVIVSLERGAVAELAGTSAEVAVPITVTAGDETVTKTARVELRVPR